MTRVWLFLVVFLLILSVFRLANGAEFIGSSEILIKLETFDFDMSPLTELADYFDSSSDFTFAHAGGGDGNSGGGTFGGASKDGSDSFWDYLVRAFDKVFSFFEDTFELASIFLKIFWMPFDFLFQVLDVVLWMLGFTA